MQKHIYMYSTTPSSLVVTQIVDIDDRLAFPHLPPPSSSKRCLVEKSKDKMDIMRMFK